MTGTTTTNLGLYKPAFDESGWDALVNANFDTLDTASLTHGAKLMTRVGANTVAGATTITLDPAPSLLSLTGGVILIGVGLNTCDYQAISPSSVSGNTVTVGALTQAHTAGEIVAVIEGIIPASWIGCVSGNTLAAANRNAAALNRFCNHTGLAGNTGGATIGLDGAYYINDMVVLQGGQIRLTTMRGVNTSGGLLAYASFPFDATYAKSLLAVCDQSGNIATIANGLGADITIWLDNFFLDGNGITNSVCCAHSPQQPGHAVNLRIRQADYGYVFGAQNYWDVRNLQVDQCHTGLVDSQTISSVYNYNYTVPVSGAGKALQFSGLHGAFYGGDLETTNGSGPLVDQDGESLILDGMWSSGIASGGAGTIVQVDASTSASYDIRSLRCAQNSLTVKFIRDVARNFSINTMDAGAGAHSVGRLLTIIARKGASDALWLTGGSAGWVATSTAGLPVA